MISLTAEYALRAVVHLAALEDQGAESATVAQIARGTRVPEGYLSKVLQQLARAGVIASQRGAGGGFRLARPASQISVYDAVHPVDPVRRILECPLGLDAHQRELCPLHKKLDEAAEFLERQFRETPITQLIESPQALAEVSRRVADASCHFPVEQPGGPPTAE